MSTNQYWASDESDQSDPSESYRNGLGKQRLVRDCSY